jgi:hypothetical protein
MIDYLNNNQGVISAISILISVVITIVGFFITNKNITNLKQQQNIKEKSKGIQGGRDATDNSSNM